MTIDQKLETVVCACISWVLFSAGCGIWVVIYKTIAEM